MTLPALKLSREPASGLLGFKPADSIKSGFREPVWVSVNKGDVENNMPIFNIRRKR
jgi:hypothetical protein